MKVLKSIHRALSVFGIIFVILGLWFIKIIYKEMGPEINEEAKRYKWIQEQHTNELNNNIYSMKDYENVDGITFKIDNIIKEEKLIAIDITVDTTGLKTPVTNKRLLEQDSELAILDFKVIPKSENYRDEYLHELITENKDMSNFPLELKFKSFQSNKDNEITYGTIYAGSKLNPTKEHASQVTGIFYNNSRSFRIVMVRKNVNVLRIATNYSVDKIKLPAAYTYLVIE